MTLAIVLALSQSAPTAVFTDDHVLALHWSADSKRLFWLTKDSLNEWPAGKRYAIPKGFKLESLGYTQVETNSSGSRILISARYLDGYLLFDPKTGRFTSHRSDYRNVWWIGDKIASIEPVREQDGWTEASRLIYDGKSRPLPRDWQFGAADEQVLLAKKGHLSPVALFRIDPKTLRVSRFRVLPMNSYAEYIEQDSIAWNQELQTAAIGLTSDTGATFASPIVSNPTRVRRLAKMLTLECPPMWVGARVLLSTREFREQSGDTIIHGADIYRIELFNPVTGSTKLIDSIDNHWKWKHNTEEHETPRRSDQPIFGYAAASRDGKRLAYIKANLGTTQIIVRPMP